MLVEGEESLAGFLITELELEGYEVIWAKDGREVLAIFKEKEITLILLDWMLPRLRWANCSPANSSIKQCADYYDYRP